MHRKPTLSQISSQVVAYAVLIIAAFFIAFPFFWMVITTVKPANQVYTTEIILFPATVTLQVYEKLLSDPQMPVGRFFLNSIIISLGSTIVTVLTAVLAAYPLARRNLRGGKLFYLLIVATMMVPGEVVLIGMFLVVNSFQLINTYQGMILPLAVNAITFLIIYNYVQQLPREMDEAALVDGAQVAQVLWYIIIPLSQPAIYSATLLAFLSAWQNFTIPYLLAQTNQMYPLAVGALFTQSTLYSTMQETLALATILTIPTLVVFVLTQRFVFTGITTGAVKG